MSINKFIGVSHSSCNSDEMLAAAQLEHDKRLFRYKLENCSVHYKASVKETVLAFAPDKRIDLSGNCFTPVMREQSYFAESMCNSLEDVAGLKAYVLPRTLDRIQAF